VIPSTATNPANYQVTGGTVTNVILAPLSNPDHHTLLLYVSGIASSSPTLTINGVKNLGGTAMSSAPVPVKTPLYAVNFQSGPTPSSSNPDAPTPPGYQPDIGLPYGDRGAGLSYGWDVDNQAPARWRQSAASPDIRFDTFIHMGKPLPAGRVWEMGVPNGDYTVYLVTGEPDNSDEFLNIDVEGKQAVSSTANQPDSARWKDGLVTVTVKDGKLTVANDPVIPDPTVANNKIDFIEIFKAEVPPVTAAPKLTATKSGNNLVLSWSTADGAGFTLQTAVSLVPPISWSPVTQRPTDSGGTTSVTVPLGTGTEFYQLKK
jgi:hypothetical protein